MALGDDLTAEVLEPLLGARPVQSHPVVLSTAVSASAWAQSDAPHGAVVVAAHQISPRGHAEKPWKATTGVGLGLALILRPELPPQREGWLYVVATTALAEVCGEDSTIEWPDEVWRDGSLAGAVGNQVRLGPAMIRWAVVNLWLPGAQPPRGELLAATLDAIDARLAGPPDALLEEYARRCATIGRRVGARLLGGTGPRMRGRAVGANQDGSLVLETDAGRQAPVRPQDVRGVDAA